MPSEKIPNEEIQVAASLGGRPITLDPIRELTVELPVREVESTIPCGFQMDWISGKETESGEEFNLATGSGAGSRWGTFRYRDRYYCFNAADLIERLVEQIGEE